MSIFYINQRVTTIPAGPGYPLKDAFHCVLQDSETCKTMEGQPPPLPPHNLRALGRRRGSQGFIEFPCPGFPPSWTVAQLRRPVWLRDRLAPLQIPRFISPGLGPAGPPPVPCAQRARSFVLADYVNGVELTKVPPEIPYTLTELKTCSCEFAGKFPNVLK